MKKQRLFIWLTVIALLLSACTYIPPEDTRNTSEPDVLGSEGTTTPAPSHTTSPQTQPTEQTNESTDPTTEPTEAPEAPVYDAYLGKDGIVYGPYIFHYIDIPFTDGTVTGLTLYYCDEDVVDAVLPSHVNGVPVVAIGHTYAEYPAFQGHEKLKTVVIPNTVQYIGNNVFRDCTNIEKMTIPSSVRAISTNAFNNCSAPKQIRITEDSGIGSWSLCGAFGLETLTIEDGVTFVPSLSGCTALKELYIPDSVTEIIGFQGCTSLTTVRLPNGMTNLGTTASDSYDDLFADTAITFLEVPDSVTFLGDYVFANSNLQSIVIPSGVTHVGDGLFYNTPSIQKIYFKGSKQDCPQELINHVESAGAAIYYYAENKPTSSGLYWHYVDGQPVIW